MRIPKRALDFLRDFLFLWRKKIMQKDMPNRRRVAIPVIA